MAATIATSGLSEKDCVSDALLAGSRDPYHRELCSHAVADLDTHSRSLS